MSPPLVASPMEVFNGVSGFLPSIPALTRLPEPYEPWELILDDLNGLLLSGQLRSRIHKLPALRLSQELQDPEAHVRILLRAHLVLSLLSHAFIVGFPKQDEPEPILPASLAVPWFDVSKALGLKPVVSYASLELANFKILDASLPPSLNNLAMLHTFSGSFDEAWFYLVPLAIEVAGAPALQHLLDFQKGIAQGTTTAQSIPSHLSAMVQSLQSMTALLKRMYERNDPHIFWTRVRPYSGGSKNAPSLPNGLFYEGVFEVDEHVNQEVPPPEGKSGTWRKYAGASAGQSPLIHALDVGLAVSHGEVGTSGHNPMIEMRAYLPESIRRFLVQVGEGPSIREFLLSSGHPDWVHGFNAVVEAYKGFRDQHIQLTTVYIIQQALKEKASLAMFGEPGTKGGAPSVGAKEEAPPVVGTGGTDLVRFLKQSRDETLCAKIAMTANSSPSSTP